MEEIYQRQSDHKTFLRIDSKSIRITFWASCCIVATLSTTVWQCLNYCYGEEQTVVEYKRFNDGKENIYPSVGLCWTQAIDEEKLKGYGSTFTSTKYGWFLTGHYWDKDMLLVDYENVTLNFDDYIIQYGYDTKKDGGAVILYEMDRGFEEKPGFNDYSFGSVRCFTIDIPFEKDLIIKRFYVHFDSSIFGKNGRLPNPFGKAAEENAFRVALHYRHQLIFKMIFAKENWPIRDESSPRGYQMLLTVGHAEILVRRNSIQTPCVGGIPDYDQKAIKTAIEKVGCKPPYWPTKSSFPPCSNRKQMSDITDTANNAGLSGKLEKSWKNEAPCRSLESIQYDVMDVETPEKWKKKTPWMNDSIGVILDFTDLSYKEIRHVRGMDVQALIGNFL